MTELFEKKLKLWLDYIETRDYRHISETKQVMNRMKLRLDPIVNHWAFESFITTCIVINTILLASEHHEQPTWLTDTISTGSHVRILTFT